MLAGATLQNLCSFFSEIEDFMSFLAASHLGQSGTNYLGKIHPYQLVTLQERN